MNYILTTIRYLVLVELFLLSGSAGMMASNSKPSSSIKSYCISMLNFVHASPGKKGMRLTLKVKTLAHTLKDLLLSRYNHRLKKIVQRYRMSYRSSWNQKYRETLIKYNKKYFY